MNLIIQNGAQFSLNEGLLTEIKKSLAFAKHHSITNISSLIYKSQIKNAKRFLIEQKKAQQFSELSEKNKRRLLKIIASHDIFLKQRK